MTASLLHFDFEQLFLVCIEYMNGACHAWIERVYSPLDFYRLHWISYRRADKRLLERAPLSFRVSRSCVPCGRHNRLVIIDLAVFNNDIMSESAARRIMKTD